MGLVLRRIDWILLVAVGSLLALSYDTIATVTRDDVVGDPRFYAERDIAYIGAGAILAVVAAAVPPKVWRRLVWPIFGTVVALLVLVLFTTAARGSQRWITLPAFNLQPSEIGKVGLAVCLAALLVRTVREHPGSWRLFLRTAAVMALPFALVFVQPDLGTSIVYTIIAGAVLLVAGARLSQLAFVTLLGIVAIVVVLGVLPRAGVEVLQDYQTQRLTAFVNPSGEAGYQTRQSKIAIGSGGLLGKGAGQGTQTTGNFLPEHHTDFIFSVIGEERGFVGAAIVLFLYILVVWRAIRSIAVAATLFESLLAAGLAGMLLGQIFVNIGMTAGIAPVTGIPLPFMTYGGSNTITNMIAVGLLIGIQVRGAVTAPAAAGGAERLRDRRLRPVAGRPALSSVAAEARASRTHR